MQFLLLGGEYLPSLLVAIFSGFALWSALVVIGQKWVQTLSNTVTYLFLPVIGYVVILVISNNVALSLGLVGALSIVRFRHPVKSPLELVMYFALVTIGIAAAARPIMALVMAAVGVGVLITVRFVGGKSKNLAWKIDTSAAEVNIIRATFGEPMDQLLEKDNLVFASVEPDSSHFEYRFATHSIEESRILHSELKATEGLKSLSSSF